MPPARQSPTSTLAARHAAVRTDRAGPGRLRARGRDTALAERALRAARAAERPAEGLSLRISWRFVGWLCARVLALGVLWAASYVVYDLATSDRFQVRSVQVTGTALLTSAEVEQAAAVREANVFWIDRRAVQARLQAAFPGLRRVEVAPILPGTIQITVVERVPAAFWQSGGQTYVVDRDGLVLRATDPDAEAERAPRACGGQPCDPRLASSLPRVTQVDGGPLRPGARVDPQVLAASGRLAGLLPRAGVQPLGFEWSRERGLEVPTQQGWRVRFDGAADPQAQLASLAAIRQHLATTGATAELIDVRPATRPYFR